MPITHYNFKYFFFCFLIIADLCDHRTTVCSQTPYCGSGWTSSCGTTYPSAAISGGAVRVTVPPYQYSAPAGMSITYINAIDKYGRNGIPYIERKTTGEVGIDNIFFTTVDVDNSLLSTVPWYYYQAGFMVYDKDTNGVIRPLLYFYYRYASSSTSYRYINSVYVRYMTSSGWSGDNRLQFDSTYTAAPMELYLIRNKAGNFQFAFRRTDVDTVPIYGSTGCFSGCSPFVVYDTWITGWSWNPNSTFVGFYAENTYPSYSRTIPFNNYKIINYNWFMNTYMVAVTAARARNATLATAGACAVTQQITRTVPYPLSSTTITGIYNGEAYYVFVTAVGAASVVSTTVSIVNPIVPAPPAIKFTTSGYPNPIPGLFLDGLSARPTGNADFTLWRDVSGNNRHFSRTSTGSSGTIYAGGIAPKVPFPTTSKRLVGVLFPAQQSELIQGNSNDDFLALNAASASSNPNCISSSCPDFENHDTTWFILYEPNQYMYASSNIITRGDNWGGQSACVGSSWEIISLYYGWPDSNLGIRIYGNGGAGMGISQKFTTSTYSHPHMNTPTLLTYSYQFAYDVQGGQARMKLNGAEGFENFDNNDKSSFTLLTGPPTKNPWITEFQWGQYSPNFAGVTAPTPGNFESFTWANFPKTQGLGRISDARTFNSWYYNYFAGYICSIAVFRGANSVYDKYHRQDIQRYMLERYFLLCPAVSPYGAVAGCVPTPQGGSCSIQCIPPGVRIGGPTGSTPMQCSGGAWVGRGTRCGAVCKVINQPTNVKSCRKVYHSENYDSLTPGDDFYSDFRYDASPALPARLFKQYFTAASGGYLQINLPGRDNTCSLLDPVVLHLNNPSWADPTSTAPAFVEVQASVLLASNNARAGVANRVYLSAGKTSYYALSIAHNTKGASLTKVLNGGTPVSVGASVIPNFQPLLNIWYVVKIVVAGNSIKGYVNGTLAFDTSDTDITVGSGGVYVENGLVLVDDFSVIGACDANGNCQATSDEKCVYQCADGYTLTGNGTQQCDLSGQYLGTPPVCIPTPPDIKPATFTVSEDALQGFVIGKLNATSLGAGREVIIYKTIQQKTPFYSNIEVMYSPTAIPQITGEISGVFGINLCSGEIYVAKAGILDYRAYDPIAFASSSLITPYQRKLIVRASVGNKNDVYTDVTITINLLRAIKPPVFLDPTDNTPTLRMFRGVYENYVGVFLDAPVSATAMEPNPIVYDIIFGNSAGFFSINNATGQLSVAKMGLNFENSDLNRFEIMVRARDSKYLDKSAVVLVEITVKDAEDPPDAPSPQQFKISESRAGANLLLGSVQASDQDIGDLIKFSVDKVAAGDNYNYLQSTLYLNETNGQLTLLRTLYYDPELSDVKVVDGLQVREAFKLPCLVTDTFGPKATPFTVMVYVLANLTTGPEPVYDSIRFPGEGVSTKGNQTVIIGGQNFDTIIKNNNNITDVWVNFTTQENDPTTFGAYCNRNCPETCDPQDVTCTPCYKLKCPRTYQLQNCYIFDPTMIMCTTVPGYGNRLVVQVRHGKLRKRMLSPEAAVFVDFARPTIVSVTGALEQGKLPENPNALPTNGGSSLILKVKEFGVQGSPVPYFNAELIVRYGTNYEYQASVMYERDKFGNLLYPDRDAEEIKIHTAEGIGKNLPFKIYAGLQESYDSPVTISYAPPVISAILPPTGSTYTMGTLSTLGGEDFIITGANFGPINVMPQELRYTSTQTVPIEGVSTSVLFSYAPNCVKSTDALQAHSRLVCKTAPGVGKLHAMVITVGNQTTTSTTPNILSYLPPVVTSLDGEGTFLADTQGGQKVNLKGLNMGPLSMGDTTPNAALSVPISATYGVTGTEYVSVGCIVSSVDATMLTCLTAPGTGKGHIWKLTVGGQAAPVYLGNTSYAPPVITAFTRTEIDSATGLPLPTNTYKTNGLEAVIIDGKNFGPTLVANKFGAVYTLSLRENKTEYNTFVGGNDNAQITFPATQCIMSTPHFQLICKTTPGAGTELGWTITVDGQPSTQPVIAYGAPIIDHVTDLFGNPVGGPLSTDGVSTDGGDTLILTGSNFGPRDDVNCKTGGWLPQHASQPVCHGYIQQIRYGRTGTEYSVADFDLASELNHDKIYVKLSPGFGKNLRFRIIIAGQASELSQETFSYRSPRVISIDPSVADTDPSSSKVIKVTITGYDFSLLDPLANVGILFGNDNDGTIRPGVLSVVDRSPDWQNAASKASYIPGALHTVTFYLPQGVMDRRAVRVAVFLNGQASGYKVVSDPIQDNANIVNPQNPPIAYFSYTTPVIDTVTVAVVNPADTDFVRWMLNSISGISSQDVNNYYVITLTGTNFGPNATVTNDRVARTIQYKPYDDTGVANWVDGQFTWYSWNHEMIVAVTKQSKAKIRVAFTGNFYDGSVDVFGSDPYQYADVSPSIGNLVGSSGPFSTMGGDVISFIVTNLKSAKTLSVTVGGRRCEVVKNTDGDPVIDIIQEIIRNPSYYNDPNAPSDVGREWTIYCMLPAGQGKGQPLVVQRDETFSDGGVTIDYQAPSVSKVTVYNNGGKSQHEFNFVSGQPLTIYVDTEPTRIDIEGNNFGICPSVVAGASPRKQLGLRKDRCGTYSIPSNYTFSLVKNNYHDHQYIRIYTDPGEGTGLIYDPIYGYQLVIDVSGQLATDNNVPQILKFRYTPPAITTVTPTGRTFGGDLITIVGTNFGMHTPTVTIGKTGTGQLGMLPCTSVSYDRTVSSTIFTCLLAEGSGANLDVKVQVSDQYYIAPANFSYLSPVISTIILQNRENVTSKYLGPANNRIRPTGPTTGGYNVTLVGDNFGKFDYNVHCLFVAWRGERTSLPFVCNAAYDFVGEGEVPLFAIISWNHTAITFVMPPGAGVREIVPFVRQQPPTPFNKDGVIWYYDRPVISVGLSPNHGTTDGGTIVTIGGTNFGKAPMDTSDSAVRARILDFPQRLDDYLTLPAAPQQIMTVEFFRSCITGHFDESGQRPALVGDCLTGIMSHEHNAVLFKTPAYIGVNRSVTVTIHDHVFNFITNQPEYINFTTLVAANFSYDPPKITQVIPAKVRMDGVATSRLSMVGVNAGSGTAWASSCDWEDYERYIEYKVAGLECVANLVLSGCPGDANSMRPGPVPRGDTLRFECALAPTTVGHKNLTYAIVGQRNINYPDELGSVFTVCAATYFGRPDETCLPCPDGAVCAGFDDRLRDPNDNQTYIDRGVHTYPRPKATFYNMNSSDSKSSGMYRTCPETVANVYPGRDVCVVACSPPEACLGDNYCAYGYRSVAPYFRCATCDIGFYKRANECVKCPDSPWALVIGFAMLVMFGGLLAYTLNKMKINLAFISIGIDYFQVLAIFAQSKVAWPPIIKELFHVLSAFNLNIEIVAPECIVPDLAYKQKWSFIMALPFAIAIFFGLVTIGSGFFKLFIKGQKVKLINQFAGLAASIFLLMYVMYIYLTRNVLDIFNCSPTDPPDGKTYLTAVFEECGIAGGTQMTLLPAAVVALLVYVLGYPLGVALLLVQNKEIVMEDQLLRAKGVGDDKLSNPRGYKFRKQYSRVYYQFRPETFLWVEAILLRKFLLSITYILFNRNPSFQLAAALLIMVLAFSAQVRFNPYMGPSDFEVVLKNHEGFVASGDKLRTMLQDRLRHVEARGRKRVHRNVMAADGKIDTRALLGLLRSWLFNYNTVKLL